MYVVRMKIDKIGSSDSVTYILVHFFVWNDFCTRAPMTVLRMLNGRVFLHARRSPRKKAKLPLPRVALLYK